MSDVSAFNDPYAQPGRGQPGTLTDVKPQGYQVQFDENGGAFAIPPDQGGPERSLQQTDHFDNLAEVLDDTELNEICTDLLDAIEDDKDSRSDRDKQYEQGLNRTGMGNNVPGGANFPGASRAIHPMLLESSIDFGGAMMNEMMPPEGPCRTQVQGDENEEKDEKAKRCARWINYQFTEVMPAAYHEFDIGFTQCPLGGGFYTKTYVDEVGNPAIAFIPIDHVYRPYSDGDFYTQPRITHNMTVDRWTYRQNVDSKLWRDVVDYDVRGGNVPEETQSDEAAARQIGKTTPAKNLDAYRAVYETSTLLQLPGDQKLMPYLVTIDLEAREVLAIYRNWRQQDDEAGRCIFLIEWPFWPWRGGYPVGLTHMIGSLSGAATGALRALLDSAMLNTSQTGMRLKGGSTAGGQNMTPRVTEIAEVQGSLAQDDIRKAFLPIQFNPPSPTLLQLLSFLVDAGRGVVRSTYDEMDKFGANTPVGTTQMFLEQGLRNLGAVHRRMHRSMRLLLKGLWQINADTLTDATVIDAQGELTVSAKDFQGPMTVIPVSDPKLWSDLQRKALAQTVVTRASDPVAGPLYNTRATESYFLKQMGASSPDQFLKANPQPQRTNAVAENVTASQGQPIKAFPGQDHEAHIQVHVAYLKSPFFGQTQSLAVRLIPQMIDHLGDHLALWYSDAMLEAATHALRQITGNQFITLESFMGTGTEVGLDRLMSELDDEVLQLAEETLKDVPEVIAEARQLLKTLAPPQPMDPSLVAQEDVQRQREKDNADTKAKQTGLEIQRNKGESDAAFKERQLQVQAEQKKRDADLKAQQLEQQRVKDGQAAEQTARDAERDAMTSAADRQAEANMAADDLAAHDKRNVDDNETAIEITEMKNASAEKTAKMSAAAAKARGTGAPKPKGRGNLTTGTGQGGGEE
jgi:hypothetical protein